MAGLASCTELAKMPAHSACASGAQAASVTQNYGSFGTYDWMHWPTAWPAADISAQRLARLSCWALALATRSCLVAGQDGDSRQ